MPPNYPPLTNEFDENLEDVNEEIAKLDSMLASESLSLVSGSIIFTQPCTYCWW